MGISGLLPLLKSIQKPTQLAKFKGQTIGVDAYVWLHRGATACAIQLALGQPTTKYVDFAMSRVRMLQHFGVVPYIVFDGDSLPSKAGTNSERHAKRKEAKKLGSELLQLGKTAQAHQELQKAVEITHEMAGIFIRELKKADVKYVVAPYEADAQLAYLEKQGHIQAVISEDSDLLVFGVKTLLTKLDQYGECIMVRREEFSACREVSLVFWTDDLFRQMAILSGCDYLDNISSLGLKTAHRLLRKHKTVERVLQAIRLEGKLKVPTTYLEDFKRAELTFLYQWVYCPEKACLVNLNSVDEGVSFDHMPFIGKHVDNETAVGVAKGLLHPRTKQTMVLPSVPSYSTAHAVKKSQQTEQENVLSKKNMTINEFFKKRQPLAELDPNSFIMTPRQSELSRRASSSTWSSTIVTSTPSLDDRLRASNNSTAQSTPSTSQARRLSTETTHENVKRQRLCYGDRQGIAATDISTAMSQSSKYFSTPGTVNSGSKKKRKSTTFSIFSDDSIDEALNNLPAEHKLTPSQVSLHTDHDKRQFVENDDSQATLVEINTPASQFFADDVEDTLIEVDGQPVAKRYLGAFHHKTMIVEAHAAVDKISVEKVAVASSRAAEKQPFSNSASRATTRPEELVESQDRRPVIPVTPTKMDTDSLTAGDVLVHVSKTSGSEDLIVSESESEDNDQHISSKPFDIRHFAFSTAS